MRTAFLISLLASMLQAAPAAPQLTFDAPAGWSTKTPSSSMRVAEFVLPGAEGAKTDASLTVYFFGRGTGGSVQANLERWVGQMTQPDGRASEDVARTETRTSRAGIPLTIVDVTGTYVAEVTPGATERFNEAGYRLIAAVVETPGGAHYVKLVGPAATVARWQASVTAFMDSLRIK